MVILSDCLTEKIDEGCLKVANSLTKRMKENNKGITVVSFDRKPSSSDVHMQLNKLFLNPELWKTIKGQSVLYIPFASNTTASAVRTLVLSFATRRKINVIFVLRFPMSGLTQFLLKLSGATVIALSRDSFDFYRQHLGTKTLYLKTGIDTKKFIPVSTSQKQKLREKYGFSQDEKIVLHVGHLKGGRNVDKLAAIDSIYRLIVVVSSVTEAEKDDSIRKLLRSRPNTILIEEYIENIEELYQLSDVYAFPVEEELNCIDVPLSVLEAASCNLPVVATRYGELKEFEGYDGFEFLEAVTGECLNAAVAKMMRLSKCENRTLVMPYDWENAVRELVTIE